eukprot:UN09147
MSVSFVSFGCDNSWVVGFHNGFIAWSGLSQDTLKILNKQRKYSDIKVFDMGDDDDYFAYHKDDFWNYSMNATFTKSDINKVSCSTIGPASSCIMIHCNGITWQGIPDRAEELIRTRNNADLKWAALGHNAAYVLIYSDGVIYWGGDIDDSLESELKQSENIQKVYLCASSKRYFVEKQDGSSRQADVSFDNVIETDTYMSPQNIACLNTSIKDRFSCDTCIYETVNALKSGIIDED